MPSFFQNMCAGGLAALRKRCRATPLSRLSSFAKCCWDRCPHIDRLVGGLWRIYLYAFCAHKAYYLITLCLNLTLTLARVLGPALHIACKRLNPAPTTLLCVPQFRWPAVASATLFRISVPQYRPAVPCYSHAHAYAFFEISTVQACRGGAQLLVAGDTTPSSY